MPRGSTMLILACLLFPLDALAAATLSPSLQQRLATLAPSASIPVILNFAHPVDVARYPGGRSTASELIVALHDQAGASQARVLSTLRGRVPASSVRSFWINNSVAVSVPSALLAELANFSEIESIDYDEPVGFEAAPAGGSGGTVDWNLPMIRADQVWSSYGLDGTGVVVGSMDTGFDPTHPALQGKWRGGTNSWIDIIGSQPTPYDDHGHGTHTIGTMVGGDGAGPLPYDVGVAYNAKFVSAKVLDATNSFSSASIVLAGAQFMLDPDGNPATNDFPAVINNSWFFFSPTYTGFHSAVAAWRAAGIVPVFCLGNSGPGASTTMAPANYDNALGIGATDSGDMIASFSSRGPSPAGAQFPPDQRKPDISAPGNSVLSSVPGGGYQYWSGTSMAAPHVAGTIALMLQGHPGLDFDTIRSELIASATDRGAAGFDYDYGYGRLDAFAATTLAVTGVDQAHPPSILQLRLAPNPFVDEVRVMYSTRAAARATIEVFDLGGRRMWSAATAGGAGSLVWNGGDRGGAPAAAGVYLVRLSDGEAVVTGRVLRVR